MKIGISLQKAMSKFPQNPTRTNEEKQAIYQEWRSSGLSKKEFCIQKALNYQTFIWWFSSKQKRTENSTSSKFVPVVVEPNSSNARLEIYLSGSRKVILSGVVSIEIIQAILKC